MQVISFFHTELSIYLKLNLKKKLALINFVFRDEVKLRLVVISSAMTMVLLTQEFLIILYKRRRRQHHERRIDQLRAYIKKRKDRFVLLSVVSSRIVGSAQKTISSLMTPSSYQRKSQTESPEKADTCGMSEGRTTDYYETWMMCIIIETLVILTNFGDVFTNKSLNYSISHKIVQKLRCFRSRLRLAT